MPAVDAAPLPADAPPPPRALVPGLLLSAALATLALGIADLPFVKDTLHVSALLLVILLGMLWKSFLSVPAAVQPGVRFAQRPVLRWAVAGLGFRLSVQELLQLGGAALVIVGVSTFAALWFGWWVAERMGVPHKLAMLLGMGGAICGASAIVAADTVVRSEKEESAVAIGVITLLGTIGIVLYPLIGHAFGMSDFVYGLWAGASLHETAQVVAAGFGLSPEAARVATVVKLARIALLAPAVFWLAWIMRRHHERTGAARVSIVPWFLVMFVVFAAVHSLGLIPAEALERIRRFDVWLLCVGMAGVGLQTGLSDLRLAGAKPILAGALQWLFLAALALALATLAARFA
jgi:uncharacterized integral membrane protein (TIGR00698 family)